MHVSDPDLWFMLHAWKIFPTYRGTAQSCWMFDKLLEKLPGPLCTQALTGLWAMKLILQKACDQSRAVLFMSQHFRFTASASEVIYKAFLTNITFIFLFIFSTVNVWEGESWVAPPGVPIKPLGVFRLHFRSCETFQTYKTDSKIVSLPLGVFSLSICHVPDLIYVSISL